MRRVYYAFALKVVTHPLVAHGALLVVSLFILTRLVNVASIVQNISNVKVGYLDNFILNSLTHTDMVTLSVFGIVCFTLLSLQWNLRSVRLGQHLQAV